MKELYLLRGLPGAGKTTLAKSIGGRHAEADQYFMEDGEYKFDASKLKDAHAWCQSIVDSYVRNGFERVIVSNTFTTEKEMEPYYEMAEKYGYIVTSLIVENRHGNKSVHNVSEETMEKMLYRFNIKL